MKKLEIKTEKIDNKDWSSEPIGQLTVDVYQTDDELVIQSAVGGLEPENLDITIENDMVTIKGKREKEVKEEKKDYFYQECFWGQFLREIILPVEVNSSKAAASIENGILSIRIPKTKSKKEKKISVK